MTAIGRESPVVIGQLRLCDLLSQPNQQNIIDD